MKKFLTCHADGIAGVLSGFDRIRFRGTFRQLSYVRGLLSILSHLSVLLKDFKEFAEAVTARFRGGIEALAQSADRPVEYLPSPEIDKESLVQKMLGERGVGKRGVIAIFSVIELCQSYEVHRNREQKRLELRSRKRKCLHYYVYLQDPLFGLVHVRLASWLPFGGHIVINGREWLARQMDKAGLAYQRADNCFPWVGNFPRAQRLADRQLTTNWSGQLLRLYRQAQPNLDQLLPTVRLDPYWSAEQSEWATDIAFRSPEWLTALEPSLLQHGITSFQSRDVMRFLGRRSVLQGQLPPAFKGEVTSHVAARTEGVRIKHRVGHNSIKMYAKKGLVLRVETTINDTRDLKVFRRAEGEPRGKRAYRSLRKGVADLKRRAELCHSANGRYLDALAAADCSQPLKTFTDVLTRRVESDGRWFRALNPLGADAGLLAAINSGEFLVKGFRNADIRHQLYGPDPHKHDADKAECQRRAARVCRLLRLLRAHGLVKKIPHTQRYLPTAFAQQCLPAILCLRESSLKKLTAA